MSILDYSISILNAKAKEIALDDPISPEGFKKSFEKLVAINNAIHILRKAKYEIEEEERNLKELKDDYEKTIDDRNIKIIKNKI